MTRKGRGETRERFLHHAKGNRRRERGRWPPEEGSVYRSNRGRRLGRKQDCVPRRGKSSSRKMPPRSRDVDQKARMQREVANSHQNKGKDRHKSPRKRGTRQKKENQTEKISPTKEATSALIFTGEYRKTSYGRGEIHDRRPCAKGKPAGKSSKRP